MVLFSHVGRDVLTEDRSRTFSLRSHLHGIRAHSDFNALWDIDTQDLTQRNPLHGPQTPRGPRDGLQRVLLPGHQLHTPEQWTLSTRQGGLQRTVVSNSEQWFTGRRTSRFFSCGHRVCVTEKVCLCLNGFVWSPLACIIFYSTQVR